MRYKVIKELHYNSTIRFVDMMKDFEKFVLRNNIKEPEKVYARLNRNGSYEDSVEEYTFEYQRPETAEEQKDREQKELGLAKLRADSERKMYERLKEKFEG